MQDYFSTGESSDEETDLDAIIARNNNGGLVGNQPVSRRV
jgi:hypothetical protein